MGTADLIFTQSDLFVVSEDEFSKVGGVKRIQTIYSEYTGMVHFLQVVGKVTSYS